MGMRSVDFDLLFRSVIKGNLENIRDLIHRGGNVNIKDNDGMTPLMCSISGHQWFWFWKQSAFSQWSKKHCPR
jgi:hypothetical protein